MYEGVNAYQNPFVYDCWFFMGSTLHPAQRQHCYSASLYSILKKRMYILFGKAIFPLGQYLIGTPVRYIPAYSCFSCCILWQQ